MYKYSKIMPPENSGIIEKESFIFERLEQALGAMLNADFYQLTIPSLEVLNRVPRHEIVDTDSPETILFQISANSARAKPVIELQSPLKPFLAYADSLSAKTLSLMTIDGPQATLPLARFSPGNPGYELTKRYAPLMEALSDANYSRIKDHIFPYRLELRGNAPAFSNSSQVGGTGENQRWQEFHYFDNLAKALLYLHGIKSNLKTKGNKEGSYLEPRFHYGCLVDMVSRKKLVIFDPEKNNDHPHYQRLKPVAAVPLSTEKIGAFEFNMGMDPINKKLLLDNHGISEKTGYTVKVHQRYDPGSHFSDQDNACTRVISSYHCPDAMAAMVMILHQDASLMNRRWAESIKSVVATEAIIVHTMQGFNAARIDYLRDELLEKKRPQIALFADPSFYNYCGLNAEMYTQGNDGMLLGAFDPHWSGYKQEFTNLRSRLLIPMQIKGFEGENKMAGIDHLDYCLQVDINPAAPTANYLSIRNAHPPYYTGNLESIFEKLQQIPEWKFTTTKLSSPDIEAAKIIHRPSGVAIITRSYLFGKGPGIPSGVHLKVYFLNELRDELNKIINPGFHKIEDPSYSRYTVFKKSKPVLPETSSERTEKKNIRKSRGI